MDVLNFIRAAKMRELGVALVWCPAGDANTPRMVFNYAGNIGMGMGSDADRLRHIKKGTLTTRGAEAEG